MQSRRLNQTLPWVWYPGVVTLGVVMHLYLLSHGLNLYLSTYLPVLLGAGLITVLEIVQPYREGWKPSSRDVKNDVVYMLLVQVLLPKLLAYLVAVSLLTYVENNQIVFNDIWRHDWPIAAQVVFMMLSAEFFRYWLHRAAHAWSPLWRLHAVHHAPQGLYWINTGRFHPLEKTLQFLLDVLPFMLLGVSAEVLSLYFVFYALNGFFQHSNIRLKFGWLNYVISTAELHRWHHSQVVSESSKNFGNNLILWDLLFGSWYLPKGRAVNELGLFNRFYPRGFVSQMATPFTAGIDKVNISLIDVKGLCFNFFNQIGLFVATLYRWKILLCSVNSVAKGQQEVLRKIIANNINTEFSGDFHFSKINSYEDFVKNVPLQDYEDLRAYIEKQQQQKIPALTEQQPLFYAVTSGTTGKSKYIPVTKDSFSQHKKHLAIFASIQHRVSPFSFSGKLLAIPGAYVEEILPGGSSAGAISGLLYRAMPAYLQKKYVAPEEVFAIKDHELKYQLILRLAVQFSNVTYMVSANPSTFIKLAECLNETIESLADDIETGTFAQFERLPSDMQALVQAYLHKDVLRAQQLRQLVSQAGSIRFADVWPNLRLIVTWTGGSCGIAVNTLRALLPPYARVLELGYLASELRVTMTLEDSGASGIPTLNDNFFEFIERQAYECGHKNTQTLEQLERGKQYYLIVTTPAGLYRYQMHDIVEVTGEKYKIPLLKFVQKGKGITNITGEKLSESQLIQAMQQVTDEQGIEILFYMALADEAQACYDIYLETSDLLSVANCDLAEKVEHRIRALNVEYDSKRASGRLKKLHISLLRTGTKDALKSYYVSKGMRENQFKILLVQYLKEFDFPIDEYVI